MQGRNFDYGHQKSDSKEGQMARRALLTMAKDLYNLYMTLNDHDDLPEWCHYKLATSRKDLSDITDYLTSKVMKMCVDKKMSTEDLRLEINNSMSESILEEGFFDFFKRKKRSTKKKLNIYDILNASKIQSEFDNNKHYVTEDLLRQPLIKLMINVGNLYDFIQGIKLNTAQDLQEDIPRVVILLKDLGLKFDTKENRQASHNIIKVLDRKLPHLSSSENIDFLTDPLNLKYDIDFDELNQNLSVLGVTKKYNENNIQSLLQKIDSQNHEALKEFYSQAIEKMETLKQSYQVFSMALGGIKGSFKEHKNIEAVSGEKSKVYFKEINKDIENIQSKEVIESSKSLEKTIKKIAEDLDISYGHLINSLRNNFKLVIKVNVSLYNFYKEIVNNVQREMLRLNVDMTDRSQNINKQNSDLEKFRRMRRR